MVCLTPARSSSPRPAPPHLSSPLLLASSLPQVEFGILKNVKDGGLFKASAWGGAIGVYFLT